MLRASATSTSASKPMLVARFGPAHLRSFASRRNARRPHRLDGDPRVCYFGVPGRTSVADGKVSNYTEKVSNFPEKVSNLPSLAPDSG
jgi:hypothetical protein